MPETKYLRCTCASCGGHIEFPADGIGMTIPCPHCARETELTLSEPDEGSAHSRSAKWAIFGLVILIVGIAGVGGAWVMAQKLRQKARDFPAAIQPSPSSKPNSAFRSRTTKPYVTNNFSVSELKIEKVPGSTVEYVVGTVQNQSDQQRFGVTIDLDLFDVAGRRIGAAKDYRAVLEPKGEWPIRAVLLQTKVASARVVSVREQP